MKTRRKILGMALVLVLAVGCNSMQVAATVRANTLTAGLVMNDTRVEGGYGDMTEPSIVYLHGYETHPQTHDINRRDPQKSTTAQGFINYHFDASEGYKFMLAYNGTRLYVTVVEGGIQIATCNVSR